MNIDASTIVLVLGAVALVGTLCSSLAAQLATSSPRAATVLRIVAAVLVDLRAAVLAGQAPPPAPSAGKAPPGIVGMALLALVALAGCTAQQGQVVGAIVGGIGPALCGSLAAIPGADGSYWGTACSSIATLIGTEIGAASKAGKLTSSRPSCDRLTPIAKSHTAGPAVAWVCPGVEPIAQAVVDGQP